MHFASFLRVKCLQKDDNKGAEKLIEILDFLVDGSFSLQKVHNFATSCPMIAKYLSKEAKAPRQSLYCFLAALVQHYLRYELF